MYHKLGFCVFTRENGSFFGFPGGYINPPYSEASIRSCEELDRSHLHLAHRGGPEVGTGTGPYGDCRSTQCCVAVWSKWLESSTRRVGFRALKKALEAPYTTKVNNRVHTSRGTTLD